jgi:hypothetical protein
MEAADVADAYWRRYSYLPDPPRELDWAFDYVHAVGRGGGLILGSIDGQNRRTRPNLDALTLFDELATRAPDDDALAFLGAGPLENYLLSDSYDFERLAVAVGGNPRLAQAFGAAYLPTDFPERVVQLRTIGIWI